MQTTQPSQNLPATAGVKHPLADLVAALERAVRNSEDNFLDLGMNLQKIQMTSASQQKKISATMGLFKGDEQNGILQKIATYVHGSQLRTGQAQEQAALLCSNLQKMIHLVDTFSRNCHSLERAGLLLHVIGTNTGIECARSMHMEATFKVVSKDTILLAEQIREATDALFDHSAKTRNEQTGTLQVANKNIEALQELSQSSNKTTDAAMAKVGELVDYSINMVNQADQLAGEITLGINRVVMGIQFHDNLRQRVEHVNQALLEMPDDSAELSTEEICQSFLTIELQKTQLEQLVEELDSLYAVQTQALLHIVDEINGLKNRLGGMASEHSRTVQSENPVAALLAGIASLEQLNNDSQALGQSIAASATRANQVAREMQTAIEGTFSIANQVKINALNAIIKAAKFGHAGEALQVLAQGMVGVSRDVRQLVTVFNGLLEQLAQLTRSDQHESHHAQGGARLEDLDVQQVFDQFADELQLARGTCDELAQNLERESHGLAFIGLLKDTIALQAAGLEEHLARFEPPDNSVLTSQRAAFGSHLYQRYTMDEEREVHRRILSAIPVAAAVTGAAAAAVDDCLFFGDSEPATSPPASDTGSGDMEFFDLSASLPTDSEPKPVDSDPAPATEGTIELFEDASPPADDGVELFDSPPASVEDGSVELFAPPLEKTENTGSIELFDSAVPAEPPAEQKAEIELWDDFTQTDDTAAQPSEVKTEEEQQNPPASQQKADATAAAEKEDFGDNIELF